MSLRLRELIKAVRSCKTAADERSVIAKECASIRAVFREEDSEYRHRNVAKLLYIHMLGYPTHFGQMECLKLIASPAYPDKRIGYLGLMLLLDERQEVLMLATHSIKSDLNHANQYVVGLALCAVANISSPEIARDAASEVLKLLGSSNPYIRKKAALCAVRIVRKVPETVEIFQPRIKSLLSERNHGVLLTGITLMIHICQIEPSSIDSFRKLVPSLVRILKNLVMSGYAPEHDVNGITDPFLQVKILQLLCMLGKGNTEASDAMNDILAQVATNTESLRNVGNAILYECVQTIMTIESEAGLRVLAINLLGRFLINRDNNIRYVALNTLAKVVARDAPAVQRHRATIVDCLKDGDVSIRRRALELIYVLVNEDNVRPLVREMINFLHTADPDMRPDLTAKICNVTQKFAPNKRWHIDTILRVMNLPGNHISEKIQASLISLISSSPDLHAYSVGKMYLALLNNPRQQALVQVAVWCIGEFGDLLVAAPVTAKNRDPLTVTESDVLTVLENILRDVTTEPKTKEFVLTSLMKLTTRFHTTVDRIREVIELHRRSINVELQQRSCEYFNMFLRPDSNELRSTLLERMPAADEIDEDGGSPDQTAELLSVPQGGANGVRSESSLIDILSDNPATTSSSAASASGVPPAAAGGFDLLSTLLGVEPLASTQPVVPQQHLPQSTGAAPSLMDILSEPIGGGAAGGGSLLDSLSSVPHGGALQQPGPAVALPTLSTFPQLTAVARNGLNVVFSFSKPAGSPSTTVIAITTTNSTPTPFTNYILQAAVPKYITLNIESPSASVVPPNSVGKVTQNLKLENSLHGQKQLMLKIKVEYNIAGNNVVEQATIANFPPGL